MELRINYVMNWILALRFETINPIHSTQPKKTTFNSANNNNNNKRRHSPVDEVGKKRKVKEFNSTPDLRLKKSLFCLSIIACNTRRI